MKHNGAYFYIYAYIADMMGEAIDSLLRVFFFHVCCFLMRMETNQFPDVYSTTKPQRQKTPMVC